MSKEKRMIKLGIKTAFAFADNINTRAMCEICSKLTVKNQENVFLVSLQLNLNRYHTLYSSVYIVDFKQINVGSTETIYK